MEHLTDAALVEKCLAGEREAFTEIVRRYQKQVYSLAYRLTNHPEDASDLAQEAFLKLYRVLEKYDRSRPFFPWMYKVVANACYSALRQKPGETVPLENITEFTPLISGENTHPEDHYEAKEVRMQVRKAIVELPLKYRLPLVLRYLEDLTYRQIADYMEVPLTTVETRLHRGKALLEKRLTFVLEGGTKHEMSRG